MLCVYIRVWCVVCGVLLMDTSEACSFNSNKACACCVTHKETTLFQAVHALIDT